MAIDHHHRMYPFHVVSNSIYNEDGVIHLPATWQHHALLPARAAIETGVGAEVAIGVPSTPAVELFGEGPGRVVATVAPGDLAAFSALADAHGVPVRRLGETGGDRLRIRLAGEGATGAAEERGAGVADALDESLLALRDAWERGLPRALGEDGSTPPLATEDR